MCTLTFLPATDGYLAGMNRDELVSRPQALPPAVFERSGFPALYPRESSGGTWFACNSAGNALALLNWNAIATRLGPKQLSRGILIPELIFELNSEATDRRLSMLNLKPLHPFRLVGIFRQERTLCEWRWNGAAIHRQTFPWDRRHWFSSSLSDCQAEVVRGAICLATSPEDAASDWLGRLHRSHVPGPGPYSVCVHRPDAATVSYTELETSSTNSTLRYLAGSPCQKREFDCALRLPFRGISQTAISGRAIS